MPIRCTVYSVTGVRMNYVSRCQVSGCTHDKGLWPRRREAYEGQPINREYHRVLSDVSRVGFGVFLPELAEDILC